MSERPIIHLYPGLRHQRKNHELQPWFWASFQTALRHSISTRTSVIVGTSPIARFLSRFRIPCTPNSDGPSGLSASNSTPPNNKNHSYLSVISTPREWLSDYGSRRLGIHVSAAFLLIWTTLAINHGRLPVMDCQLNQQLHHLQRPKYLPSDSRLVPKESVLDFDFNVGFSFVPQQSQMTPSTFQTSHKVSFLFGYSHYQYSYARV